MLNVSCYESYEQVNTDIDSVKTEDVPDQISWGLEVFFIDSSFTKALLKAKKARTYKSRMETFLDSGLSTVFYTLGSDFETNLTADSARIDDKTKNMIARGHVVVISDSSKTKLETSLLEWNNKEQKFYSTEFVRITSPMETIQGYGFESDHNLENYRISKVSGEKK